MKQVEVVFCGNSVYFCGLASSLQQYKEMRIGMVDKSAAEILPELTMLCPDVVIIEAAYTQEILDGLLNVESRMVIAVYLETDSIEVFWRKNRFHSSVDGLPAVIWENFVTASM